MTLQASGTIKFSDINKELGRSVNGYDQLGLGKIEAAFASGYSADYNLYVNLNSPSKPSYVSPASISEWYSYNHNYTTTTTSTTSTTTTTTLSLFGPLTIYQNSDCNYTGSSYSVYYSSIANGYTLYSDQYGFSKFNGGGSTYYDGSYSYTVSSLGVISGLSPC